MITNKKKRYLLVAPFPSVQVDANMLSSELEALMGKLDFASAEPKLIKTFPANMFLLQCRRGYEKKIALSLAFIRKLNGESIALCTVTTSGTIKAIERKLKGLLKK